MQGLDLTYNILIVEDNVKISNLIASAFKQHEQFKVCVVNRVNYAKREIERKYYDLICLDIMLPDGNGIEFYNYLRSDLNNRNTKVIIISQKTEISYKIEMFKLGVDDYLTKPFHPAELSSRVTKALGLIQPINTEIKYKNLQLNKISMRLHYEKYELPLTKTDFLILQFFFEHKGYANLETLTKYLSTKKQNEITSPTVIVYVKRLKDKLEKTTGNPFIKTKYGAGYYIP